MAIIHMDGFDTYGVIADVLTRYPGASTSGAALSLTGGRFGGGCFYPGSNGIPINIPHTGSSALIVGGAVLPTTGTSSLNLLQLVNTTASSTTELLVMWDLGVIRLYRGPATTLLASSTAVYSSTTWHHIEVKATIADSGGAVEIRVDGAVALTYSGDTRQSATGTAGIDRVLWVGSSSTIQAFDDLYVIDSSGSPSNFLGDCRINTLAPTSDSAVQFTKSTGASNYLCVDEVRQNGDTDYVESSTVTHKDVYGYADLPAAAATIHGCQVLTWMKKTDAANRTVRGLMTSGGVTTTGATVGLTGAYGPVPAIIAADPATGTAWTASGVNGALGGFEIVT